MGILETDIIKPFRAFRPKAGFSNIFVCPPYDVINDVDAKKIINKNPSSFLRIVKPHINSCGLTNSITYNQAKNNLQQIIRSGNIINDPDESFYIYKIEANEHVQIGLVALVSTHAYENNLVKPHERTLPDKLLDRIRFTQELKIQSGPTILFHRHNKRLKKLLTDATKKESTDIVITDKGIKHTLWIINEKNMISLISTYINSIKKFYIADGHHRISAVSTLRRNLNVGRKKSVYDYFLACIFSDNDLKINTYNRIIKSKASIDPSLILNFLKNKFSIVNMEKPSFRSIITNISMYLDRCWYKLYPKVGEKKSYRESLELFDICLDELTSFLGSHCTKDYLPSPNLLHFQNIIDTSKNVVGFFIPSASTRDILKTCDNGLTLPPKSTFFEPKLADGFVTYIMDSSKYALNLGPKSQQYLEFSES